MLVKICGITSPKLACFAAKEGADFIGINFFALSKRCVDEELAKEITEAAHAEGAKVVGVFVDHMPSEIERIYKEVGLDFVQIHTREKILLPIYIPRIDLYPNTGGDFLMIDHVDGGSGKTLHWDEIDLSQPFILAGGLTPENVQDAITACSPIGVDVCSGVENSEEKIRKFIGRSKTHDM